MEQRKALKRILGRKHRKLVTLAARSTKQEFLAHYLDDVGTHAIQHRLYLEPGRFWRVARGKEFMDLPTPPRQLLLFSEQPVSGGPAADDHRLGRSLHLQPTDPVMSLSYSHG